ncbi:MAG: TAXI family TRAP transporter solute-binding subunit [Synechococcales cyanobacterium C42_A2020_086]|nr:TAXI family TRAP transporter solute-binding subunit [Synechococcales cyanobacterium C42_A2020_086]
MQRKFTLPVVGVSIIAAITFAALWFRNQNQVHQLTIATGSREGEYYAFAQALATVVERHQPQIRISVAETEGSRQNLELLDRQQVQLAIVQSDTPSNPDARAVAYLFPEVFHLVARAESGIQSVNQLRGRRVAIMPRGSGSYALFWALAEHYNLREADFTPVSLSPEQAYTALRQNQVDALFRVMALGNRSMRELLNETRAQLVPIDQVESLRLSLPYLEATTIPKGTYDGATPVPPVDLPVVGVRAVLITHANANADVIQQITRTLYEFRNELVALYPRAATVRLPESRENLGLPLHPGAQAFYDQDRPIFLVEYAEPIGLLISVSVLVASGLWQFRLWLEGRQKNRADTYNLEILALIEQIQTAATTQDLEAIRVKLFDILREVVVDLDNDRISPESFQSFTLPWEVAITTLRHREMMMLNPWTTATPMNAPATPQS